ncbi:electron transport complex subunit RsxD [Endothiovibrio diazotrophicus]
MQFPTVTSPHLHDPGHTGREMFRVMAALLPGLAALTWYFGWGVVVNATLATSAAILFEAVAIGLRGRSVKTALGDGSALVTALLLTAAIPPLLPWWTTVVGIFFAIVVAKHLYGGLGHNPFNPAMVAYVVLLISFPKEMTSWLPPLGPSHWPLSLGDTLHAVFLGTLPSGVSMDALTMASPLDYMKVQLAMQSTISEILTAPSHGLFGGLGWEWVDLAFLAGGLWMIFRRTITWHIPAAMLGTLFLLSLVFFLFNPDRFAPPTFHLFSGAAMLGAFFIATDPVTACTTERGRVIYGIGIGAITYVIRTWGGYPDGVAFGVLLMNMAAPTIDYYTQPRVFGKGVKKQQGERP